MPRTFTNYQVQSLYVGQVNATGYHFSSGNSGTILIDDLHRVQSVSHDYSRNRTPINQFGQLEAIDRPEIDPPSVSLGFDYLLHSFSNENALGLITNGTASALSGILNKTTDEKNYWIKIVDQGADSITDTDVTVFTKGFGNGFLSSYSTQASVGSLPTVSVKVEALNYTITTGVSGPVPAIVPNSGTRVAGVNYTLPTANSSPGTGSLDISVLRAGDITMVFRERNADDEGIVSVPTGAYTTFGADLDSPAIPIQGYSLSFDLSRQAINKLGSRFSTSREPNFPVDISLSVDVLAVELNTGDLSQEINCDKSYDVLIQLYKPITCSSATRSIQCQYWLKNAKINSESSSSSIGSNGTLSYSFTSQIGGPNATSAGLYLSGVANNGDLNI